MPVPTQKDVFVCFLCSLLLPFVVGAAVDDVEVVDDTVKCDEHPEEGSVVFDVAWWIADDHRAAGAAHATSAGEHVFGRTNPADEALACHLP